MRLRRSRLPVPPSILLPPRWRRGGTALLTIVAAAVLIVSERTARGPIQGGDRASYHDRAFRVVHVVDGDTIDIDAPDAGKTKTRIRLWGVDTPEIAHGDQPEMYFGREAKEFAKQTLAGKDVNVVLAPERTRDKYGRLLAYVFCERGGPMFNEMLLEEGYAYADLRFDHSYKKQFESIEKRARKAGVGLWAGITLDQMPAWKQRFERKAADASNHR
jgi:endonuclease YncB( thermonuclease family)